MEVTGTEAPPECRCGNIGCVEAYAGGWALAIAEGSDRSRRPRFAAGARSLAVARIVFALALPTIGLSHFVYLKETVAFVPPWLPAPAIWAYLTGAGSIAACAALLVGVAPRLAATLEAAMLTIITLLVWAPKLFAPYDRTSFTGFAISLAIAAGAWIVAETYRGGWLDRHAITRP